MSIKVFPVNAQFVDIYHYKADANTYTPTPASGMIRWDNATQISAAHIYVASLTEDAIDIDNFFSSLASGQQIFIQDTNASENYQIWIIGSPVQNVNYIDFPVTLESSAGTGTTNFANNHPVCVGLFQRMQELINGGWHNL